MATFLRLASRQTCRLLTRPQTLYPNISPLAFISTTKENKDSITVTETIQSPTKTVEKLDEKEENWISYGYDYVDREEDEWQHHMWCFLGVGVLCWGGFLLAYFPDMRQRDWIQREAYLELARREQVGLPHIDPNLVDPEKLPLPSEEELGDFPINI